MGAIYITLALIGAVPFWLVALIFGRDALILLFALSALAFTRLRSFPPSFWGKLSTFLQVLTAVVVMVTLAFPEWPVAWLRPAMFGAAAVGTSWSGLDYFRRGYLMLRQRRG
jgi:cardiolipin synthase